LSPARTKFRAYLDGIKLNKNLAVSPEPSRPARRCPIIAGARVRHILGAEGICAEVHGLQCVVEWETGERELRLMGFLEAIPGEFT
jgi:hypothetical protein